MSVNFTSNSTCLSGACVGKITALHEKTVTQNEAFSRTDPLVYYRGHCGKRSALRVLYMAEAGDDISRRLQRRVGRLIRLRCGVLRHDSK